MIAGVLVAAAILAADAKESLPLLSADLLVSVLQQRERERARAEAGAVRARDNAKRARNAVQYRIDEARLKRIQSARGSYLPSLAVPLAARAHGVLRLNFDTPFRLTVMQVIDRGNMLIRFAGQTYWLENFSTEGMADGQTFTVTGSVAVREQARQYASGLGATRTVLVITPTKIPDGELEAAAKKAGLRK